MPKGTSASTAAIQALLDEKRQYEAWLSKLNAAGDLAPKSVRQRIKFDYEARLKAVNEQLQGQTDTVRQMIAEKKRRRTELIKEEAGAAERLEEAKVRYSVGEYEQGQWVTVQADLTKALVEVRDSLTVVEQEVEKLEEILGLAEKPPAVDKAAAAMPKVGPPPRPEKRKEPVDELAFLKSVTEDKEAGPSPKRASGAMYQPKELTGEPIGAASAAAQKAQEAATEEVAKTLKCGECGVMNVPTEWYCEQCGAELAAL